jgi:two-component sensor histidine kinase
MINRDALAVRLRDRIGDRLPVHLLASALLVLVLWLNLLLWPISWLGYTFDLPSSTLIAVEPGSAADVAGLQPGDRLLAIRGWPMAEIVVHPNLLEVIYPLERPIPMVIERDGVVQAYNLMRQPPDLAFQSEKLSNLVLALLCWLTGYLLGFVRHADAPYLPIVGLFWLVLGGVLGSYVFAAMLSLPLRTFLLWFMLSGLLPLGVAIHAWFPFRNGSAGRFERTHRWFIIGTIGFNLLLAGAVLGRQPSLVQLGDTLGLVVPVAVLGAVLAAAVLLIRDYPRITVAHTRRQIRVLALAFVGVAAAWTVAFLVPLIIGRPALLTNQHLNLIAGAIPLAYLLVSRTPDLDRADRIVRQVTGHLLTLVVLAALPALATVIFALEGAVALLWIAVAVVALYRPVHRLILRLTRLGDPNGARYAPLAAATTRLASSLDDEVLVQVCRNALQQTFAPAGLALYLRDDTATPHLHLRLQEEWPSLPAYVPQGRLTTFLANRRAILESRVVHPVLAQEAWSDAEEHLVQQPGIVLWCPLVDAQAGLLGLLLLGGARTSIPTGTRIGANCNASSTPPRWPSPTALPTTTWANLASRYAGCWNRCRRPRSTTAQTIARELHDEVININLRLNIEAVQRLLAAPPADPGELHRELALILEGERTTIEALRLVCADLDPLGYNDPYGFAVALRLLVERMEPLWNVPITLQVQGQPLAIPSATQRQVIRVAREALANALKHAKASQITVTLRFPHELDDPIVLSVRDDGRTGQPIVPKPGHWGLRYMQEGVQTIGGRLAIETGADGTEVRVAFVG